MRKMSKMLWFAAMLGCCLGLPKDASAAAHCFFSLACQDNTNYKSTPLKGWLWDSPTLATYTGLDQQGDRNQTEKKKHTAPGVRNRERMQSILLRALNAKKGSQDAFS